MREPPAACEVPCEARGGLCIAEDEWAMTMLDWSGAEEDGAELARQLNACLKAQGGEP